MRINTRFPVAIHILAFIAINGSQSTSETIAQSVNTNAVVVRRLNAQLKKAGLLITKNGMGGAQLSRPLDQISLLDIFQAVRAKEDALIFETPQHPNFDCPIGGHILDAIDEPFFQAQKAMEDTLARYTLQDIVNFIKEKM